jgi:CRISPR-associated protein (TIGR03986 family)
MESRERGKIKVLKEGFGFLGSGEGDELFFAYSFLKCRPEDLGIGTEVTFIRKESKKKGKGWEAHDICITDPVHSGLQEYTFLNPYNFVRYNKPFKPGESDPREVRILGKCPPPGHDRYLGLNGRINCIITAATPLFISDSHGIESDSDNAEHKIYRFFQYEGEKAIPASSLRGMIRSVFEAATNSCFTVLDNKRLSYRTLPQEAIRLVPGRVTKDSEGDFNLQLLCGDSTLSPGTAPKESQYAAWVPQYRHNNNQNITINEEWRDGHKLLWAILENKTHHRGNFSYWEIIKISDKEDNIGEPNQDLNQIKRCGWLYYTGKNINGKHDERFFWCNEDDLLCLPIAKAVKDEFEKILNDYHERKEQIETAAQNSTVSLFIQNNKLKLFEGDLVYALVKQEGDNYCIEKLVPVLVPRVYHKNSVGDLLEAELHKCTSFNQLCPACRVFGWVKGQDKQSGGQDNQEIVAYRGRLQFSHGIKTKENGSFNQTLDILGAPKPTTGRFYLLKKAEKKELDGARVLKGAKVLDGANESDCRYDSDNNILRGRKYYLHHSSFNEQESVRPGDNGGIKDRQNRTAKGIQKTGTQFKCNIDFNNLADVELGALLWSLQLDGGFHRLGYAKPLGFGSVQIEISSIELFNPQARYETPGSSAGWSDYTGQEMKRLKDGLASLFKSTISKAYNASLFDDLVNIKDIKTILNEPKINLPIHYPRSSIKPSKDGRNYEWFMGNKRRVYKALPLPGKNGLPIIDKDGNLV